jgi:hypothetical protein
MLPGGSVWNLVDFVPDELGAAAVGRGSWSYFGPNITGASVSTLAVGDDTGEVIASDSSGKVYDVTGSNTWTSTLNGAGTHRAAFSHRGKVIYPPNVAATVPKYALTGGGALAALSSAPTGTVYGCVYKDHSVLAGNASSNTNRVWFSAAGDPTTWDLSFGWWDTSGTITGVAPLANSILIFHADSTERLRGSSPPPGSDMILEPFLPNVGCLDNRSIAYWQQNAIFASASGIYMTNGVSTVDLTAAAQMKTYWQSTLAGYGASTTIAGGIYRDHYIVSVAIGGTFTEAFCVSLQNRTMWRFKNLYGTCFQNSTAAVQEELYMGTVTTAGSAGEIAKLSGIWSPSGSPKKDGNVVTPTPIIETGSFRGYDRLHRRWIESMGLQKWRYVYLDYDLRDAASDNPTITLSYATTPGGSYTTMTGGTIPETTDYGRVRRSVHNATVGAATRSNMMEFKLAVNGPYAAAKIYTLEGTFEPIDIGRLK